jgi:hypothetical protein
MISSKQVRLKELGKKTCSIVCTYLTWSPGFETRPGGEKPDFDFLTCGALIKCSAELCLESQLL